MLVSRAGLSPLMVGRDAELGELRSLFAGISSREAPAVVIVSGEAGVGKTRLLRELSEHVTTAGGAVLAGKADETTLVPPFEILRDAVQPIVGKWSELPEKLVPRAHALGHVLSPLLPEAPAHEVEHEHTVDELVRAAVDLVVELVGDTPTLIAFEDLHWGDAESIALFTRLAATPDLPALLLATFRPEDFDRRHPLARALPSLERQHAVVHMPLGRLDERALSLMLESVFGRPAPMAAVTALHRRTQGSPFFLEELVAGCADADPADLATAPLPWNAAEAVLRRVDDLDGATRRLLDTASLLGTRIPFDLLAAVSEQDEDALIEGLHTLVDRGLLSEIDVDVFGFRHALTREAVASQLLGREQRRVHEAALRALEAQGSDDVAALAQHAAGARDWPKLVAYARAGVVRYLREGAGLQALQLAELALQMAEDIPVDDELVLRRKAARAAYQIWALDAAQRHTDQWERLASAAGRRADESAAWRQRSLLLHIYDTERYEQAVARAREIAEELGPGEELAWAYAYTSQAHMLGLRPDEAIAWADKAIALADEVGAPHVRPWALINKGSVLVDQPGGHDEALALLEEAAEEALARGDYMSALRARNNTFAHLVHGVGNWDLDRAEAALDLADALADRYGMDAFGIGFAGYRAHVASLRGDLAAMEEALLRYPLDPSDSETAAQTTTRAIAASERGQSETALQLLTAAQAALPGLWGKSHGGWLSAGGIVVGARLDDRALVESGIAFLVENSDISRRVGQLHCAMAAEAFVLAADRQVAVSVLEPLVDIARTLPREGSFPVDRCWLVQAEARLAEHDGDHEHAAAGYREVLTEATRRRPAMADAAAHMGLARCLVALGERAEALEQAERAVRRLERWPGWRRDEAEQLARRLSGARTSASGDAPAGLTPRELEVLALIAEGCSNREIAERLYIATKTAAVHVSNILAKVGAASRTEAASWALRSGALDPEAEPSHG